MAQSGQIVQIFKSRANMLDILKSQGYDVEDYEGSSIHEVHSMFQAKQMDMLVSKNDGTKKAYIKYHLAKSLRPNNLYEYIDDLYNLEEVLTNADDLIIIMKDDPNETIIKTLRNIWEQDGTFITIFSMQRLQFNILTHSLVPPHIVLTSDEATKLKIQYNVKDDSQLPDISRFSPVAQAIGMRPGDMCKIIRPSKTAISTTFYRICSS
jgi:DNA-directed RNA polymerase I, II, and III subunit RPABC1